MSLLALLAGSASAAEPADECQQGFTPASGSYDFAEKNKNSPTMPEGTHIDQVYFTRLQVFDLSNPREDNWLYRWANRFHILTTEPTIKKQILFDEGEPYQPRSLEETARLLRSQGYLYDAAVRPVNHCEADHSVDVEVITRDVWSFTPDFSFGRSGGENTYRVAVRDTNIFGSGQEVGVVFKEDLDRETNEVFYKNKNVFNGRIAGRFQYADNDDGSEHFASIQLPFYSLDSTEAWGFRIDNTEQIDTQYFRGDDISEVIEEREDYMAWYGFSKGLVDGVARRWVVGYRYREVDFDIADELPPPTPFPLDKRLSYPFIEYSSVVDDYTTATDLNQIHRTEDIHLGHTFFNRIGYASSEFGSDQDRLVMEGAFDDMIFYNGDILWRHAIEWRGMYNLDTSDSEDVVVTYNMRYFRNHTKHRSFYASLTGVWSKNLNTNQQVVFGGDTGARAFDNRFQVGDRRWNITLEERVYTDIHLLNLIRLGFAVFIDVGRAWSPDVDDGFDDDYLANIGVGLRLASTKANAGSIVHVDLAFPLTNEDDPSVDSSEFSVSVKNQF